MFQSVVPESWVCVRAESQKLSTGHTGSFQGHRIKHVDLMVHCTAVTPLVVFVIDEIRPDGG
jgi:hypothetical protein